ncbi:MAG: hypothetical protein CL920_34055 [Deltaproteobacteria bacterium]|nr:hypothetical protein [Deltaproteobacteria bacterium]MBU53747.1 hypothetical protein [Deltaproteobacteria bacterium]
MTPMHQHLLRPLIAIMLLGFVACTSTNNTNEQPSNDASVSDTQPKESPIETAPRKDYPLDDVLRFNHIQVLGTHNSYHIAPKQGVADWKYTHSPLETQLQKEGVRQFELDLYWGVKDDFFLVQHVPVLDPNSHCYSFKECLTQIKAWSDVHTQHIPITILIEPKGASSYPDKPYEKMSEEVLSVFPKERVLKPDDVRGSHPDLKTALAKDGWPTLGQIRGKVMFVLMLTGEARDAYTNGGKHLHEKLMFVTAEQDAPYAAVAKMDGPEGDNTAKIQQAAKAGLLIRTRADADLDASKEKNESRLSAALASGAHWLSTDFPNRQADSGYMATVPKGTPARCNPVTAPPSCNSKAIEDTTP